MAKPKRKSAVVSSEIVRRLAALENAELTLKTIQFKALIQRIRDHLNRKAGWNAWT